VSESFRSCSILITGLILLLQEWEAGEALEPSSKSLFLSVPNNIGQQNVLLICSLERAEEIFGYSIGNDRQLNVMNEENLKSIGINEGILNWWPNRCCRKCKKLWFSKIFNKNSPVE
jgi:hypothetical protein